MKKNLFSRFISLVLTTMMIVGLLPTIGVMAADGEAIAAISKDGISFRLAVVSDSHIGVGSTKYNNLDKALGYFNTIGGVDALAMNGDMVYAPAASNVTSDKYVYNGAEVNVSANLYDSLKTVIANDGQFTLAGTQEGDVFTADTTEGKLPIIYAMGNHGYPENDRDTTRANASRQLFTEQTGRATRHIMNVGGYTFVMGDAKDFFNDYSGSEEFVMEQIEAAEAADPSNKPIFLLQHEPVFGTVENSDSSPNWNTQSFKDFLNEHPRVIVLSAHTHVAENDPRTIWQDGFTAMSTAQLGGGSTAGDGAKYNMGNQSTGSQCMMIDLIEKESSTEVEVYRINVLTGKMIGDPYTFTIDGTSLKTETTNATFKYGSDRYDAPSIAKFKSGSELTINTDARSGFKFTYNTTDVEITPGEEYLQDDFVHSYRVVVENTDADVVVQNFRVMGDFYEAENDQLESYPVILPNQLDRATNYKISVYALTPFMANLTTAQLDAKGAVPVTYSFKTSEELTDTDKAMIRTHSAVNVALGKTVIAGNPNHTAETAAKMVNGSYSDVIHADDGANTDGSYTPGTITLPSGENVDSATHQQNDWFIVDLGRRYNISEVKVWGRGSDYNASTSLRYFDIQASNTEDFESYETLGGITTDSPSNKSIPAVINGDGNYYRYIRLQRTGNTSYGYSEIEVFADVKAQEISRNRSAEVNVQSYDSMGASKTVDGILTNNSNCWLVEGSPAAPYNLVVDLEQDYPVGMIEMFGRYNTDASAYRNNWKIYGYTNAQGKPDVNATAFADGTQLFDITSAYPQITNSTNPEGFKGIVNGNGKYRYLVFSKYKAALAAIGEIRAELLLPSVVDAQLSDDGTEVTVSFTDKMDAESLEAEGAFSISNGSNEFTPSSVTLEDSTAWDGGYEAVLTFDEVLVGGGLELTVDGNVKTQQGASFVEDATLYVSGKTIAINKEYSKMIENVNVALNKPVTSNSGATNGNLLTNGIIKDGGVTGIKAVAKASSKGANFVIDLGQRYNVKKINVRADSNNGNVPRYLYYTKITGSNSVDFANATSLGSISSSNTSMVYEIQLDGTQAYRYIKIEKTANAEGRYEEIEVYADVMTTEVSRGATVTIDDGYTNALGTNATAKLTDGNNSSESGGVLFESIINSKAAPYNILVDLGSTYPIGMIEMWGRGNENGAFASSRTNFRQNWTVYGSASAPANAQTTTDMTTMLTVGSTAYPASGLHATVQTGNYRYLTLSKTVTEHGCVGELRASVLNPMLLGAKINHDGSLTATFSDKLDPSAISEDDISIDGVEVTGIDIDISGWDGGYEVVVYYDGTIKNGTVLTVDETVRSQNGIEMAEDGTYTFNFVTNKVLKAGDAVAEGTVATGTVYTFTASYNGNAGDSGNVYIVLKKDTDSTEAELENVVTANKSTFTADDSGKATLTASLDTTDIAVDGCWIEVYVWDNNLSPYMTGKHTFGK